MVKILPGKIRSNYKKSFGLLQITALKPCTDSRGVINATSVSRKNVEFEALGNLSKNKARETQAA